MLSIIIISYNSAMVLIRHLEKLIDTGRYPVIIVDNASSDGSAETLRNRFSTATVTALPQNIGYGRAANIGLNAVNTPYAILLNPDLAASVDDIQKLLDHALNNSDSAIWGPASESRDFTGEPPQSVEWVPGCAMLFNMDALRRIGFFDENIFLFFEETDLCKRTRDAGYEIKFCKDVYFDHKQGKACESSPSVEWLKNWHSGWSRCYYFNKHVSSNPKRKPKRQHAQYRWKALIATNPKQRTKYQAQAAGAKAFLNGEKAFLPDGSPQR